MSRTWSAGELAGRINAGIEALGQQPRQHPVDSYVSYLQLLEQWGKAYNLTAVCAPDSMVTHHILDSLAVLPYLYGVHALDVGTGAGMPGLILALARPAVHWTLLDSRRKKIRFLNQVIMELGLANVETVCARVEEFRPGPLFTTVITRAFGSLHKFYTGTRHLLTPDGLLLAMKGGNTSREIEELQGLTDTLLVQVHSLAVPGVNKKRCLVEIRITNM